MHTILKDQASLVAILEARAEKRAAALAYAEIEQGCHVLREVTYGELCDHAKQVAAFLRDHCRPGQRVMLALPSGIDFVIAYLACTCAEVIAVPVPPFEIPFHRSVSLIKAIYRDAQPTVVISARAIAPLFDQACDFDSALREWPWIYIEDAARGHQPAARPKTIPRSAPQESDIAYLQYTSGSTGEPHGVPLTHGHLLRHTRILAQRFALKSTDIGVTWNPLFHAMGLFAGVIHPLIIGYPSYLMSPYEFLKHPHRWLEAISHFRVTYSGGPNFSFDLCTRRVPPQKLAQLDLTHWQVAYLASETIRATTLTQFSDRFAGQGFQSRAFCPGYGLSEASTRVTNTPRGAVYQSVRIEEKALQYRQAKNANTQQTTAFVSCGPPLTGVDLRIVDPTTAKSLPDGIIGEVWVRGDIVAHGYWNNEQATAETFSAALLDDDAPLDAQYLRTGDLGFITDGELVITGRLKDLIIIRGRNYYPQQLEEEVEHCHPSLRPGCTAAFAVDGHLEERLIVVAEMERRHQADRRSTSIEDLDRRVGSERRQRPAEPGFDAEQPVGVELQTVRDRIKRSILKRFMLRTAAVVLIQAGTIPKTATRKLRRRTCREQYLARQLVELH